MKTQEKKKVHKRPNRIEYIVFGNPKGARKLMDKYGYVPPENKEDLARAIKLLVKEKGSRFIKELLLIHPEREVILNAGKDTEDNYCGCQNSSFTGSCGCRQSSFTGEAIEINRDWLLDRFSFMSTENLEKALNEAKQQLLKNPDSKDLKTTIESLEKEIAKRKGERNVQKEQKTDPFYTDKHFLIGATLGLVLGIILTKIS